MMLYEYVITDGPGTLLRHGTALVSFDGWMVDDMQDIAIDAMQNGWSIQCEPCADDCETGL